MVNQADLEAIVKLIEEFGWSGIPVYPLNPNLFQDALTLNQVRDLARQNGILVFFPSNPAIFFLYFFLCFVGELWNPL